MAEKKSAGKSKSNKLHRLYDAKGESLARKGKSCPKCGGGFALAQHKDRVCCGKCHYTEFSRAK
ncbi:30S ribosomal protein S27ae [Candidatus Woesearchaeota archaeon]|nr:30S ribosomal protein S27ae [Candidatus Woesearchaeota archaeon]